MSWVSDSGTVVKRSFKKGTYITAIKIPMDIAIEMFKNLLANSESSNNVNASVLDE